MKVSPQSLRLINERSLIKVCEELPVSSQPLGDLRVVHLGVLLRHLPPLAPGPHHEGVHGALDMITRLGAGPHHEEGVGHLLSLQVTRLNSLVTEAVQSSRLPEISDQLTAAAWRSPA